MMLKSEPVRAESILACYHVLLDVMIEVMTLIWYDSISKYTICEHQTLPIILAQWISPRITLVLHVHVLLSTRVDQPSPLGLGHCWGYVNRVDICCLFLQSSIASFSLLGFLWIRIRL